MSKQIEVVKAQAFEIKAGKNYLITFDAKDMSIQDIQEVAKRIVKWGAEDCIAVALRDGKEVKVIEV